ncbi:MAG TPA: hypothetical protein VFC19_45565 [Candidatus Limnocylindrales bacterium]|nr:hypothetical protein [Candidatus Limnocylindrales bacterium]
MATVSRHMPVFRRCVESNDAIVFVTRAHRPDRPVGPEFVLLLTHKRMVITQESKVLRRLRLHLNSEIRHLANITWHPDPHLAAIELAATAIDGIRERFWIHAGHPKQVWHLDALFSHVFRPRILLHERYGRHEADHLVRA